MYIIEYFLAKKVRRSTISENDAWQFWKILSATQGTKKYCSGSGPLYGLSGFIIISTLTLLINLATYTTVS